MADNQMLFNEFKKAITQHPFLKKQLSKKQLNNSVSDYKILFNKYQSGDNGIVDWDKISPLKKKDVVAYEKINKKLEKIGQRYVSKVAMIKLNGGMGTSMGCKGAKSVLSVDGLDSFIDKLIKQARKNKFSLLLMNSYNTEAETKAELKRLNYKPIRKGLPYSFLQNLFPRIDKCCDRPLRVDGESKWYRENYSPPGHGDIFRSLYGSGLLEKLLKMKYRYAFVSNGDNLAASLDKRILGYIVKNKLEFVMQTTSKTKLDVKGGTLVRYKDELGERLFLLERAQCPKEHIKDFEDIKEFKIFNTNLIWFDLKALDEFIKKHGLAAITEHMPLIVNNKKIMGHEVVQLEQAMGAAISLFSKTCAINTGQIDREDVFMPIKKTDDFFRLVSDYCIVNDQGFVRKNPKRKKKLGLVDIVLDNKYYKDINEFLKRVDYGVSLLEAKSISIKGDFYIKKNVKFIGKVELVNRGKQSHIIEGEVLKNGRYEVKKGSLQKTATLR